MSTFYHGDCLFVMRHDIPQESVDLIYLDPPFFTGRVMRGTWEPGAMEISYDDSQRFWREKAGVMTVEAPSWLKHIALRQPAFASYLYYMMTRLRECRRVMKPTASIYLHCDPRASHYLKMIMDDIFGADNFRSDITWRRSPPHNDAKNWSPVADHILYYVKDIREQYTWNRPAGQHAEGYVETKYRFDDNDGRGRYRLADITSPNPRPNMMYEWKGFPSPAKGWRFELAEMVRLDEDGFIWYPDTKTKRPQVKIYLEKLDKPIATNVWTDISPINSQAEERIGYPTQKPKKLLGRIIDTSSNPGQVVLDPFCGCGTAIFVAQECGRDWIGIDINKTAYQTTTGRSVQLPLGMQDALANARYTSRDLEEVKAMNGKAFELWVNEFFRATKPYPDGGVDGIMTDGTPIQAKSYEIKYDVLSKFLSDAKYHPLVPQPVKRIVAASKVGFDDNARKRAFEAGVKEGIEVQLLTPVDLLGVELQHAAS